MSAKKESNVRLIDDYIKAHPGVSGSKIREDLNLSIRQFWKATPHIEASSGRFGQKVMYWHGEKPQKPYVFLVDESRKIEVEAHLKALPILTRWVGGYPCMGAA
jgi:hypothetical protein